MRNYNYLFADGDLSNVLRAQEQAISKKVNEISQDQFLISTDEQLLEHLLPSFEVEPLVIYEDRKTMDQVETEVDVNDYGRQLRIAGTKVSVFIPFTGDHQLWKLKPSSWRTTFPIATIQQGRGNVPGNVVIEMAESNHAPQEKFKQSLESTLGDIRFYVDSQRNEVEGFNQKLPGLLNSAIADRRQRIEKHSGITNLLDIPLRKKDGTPDITPINVKKRIATQLPPAPKGGFKPEPGIKSEQYEEILQIIRHQCKTWESTPGTYQKLEEEELRDIINSQLNGTYEGAAAGEVFRKRGKTDIRIEDKERAAFIAECKIWKGEKSLKDALEQLLGYLTWRDCKTALIFFNKTVAGFSAIQAKLEQCLDDHERLITKERVTQSGEWRYIFKSYDDEERAVTVHVFLLDIYLRPEPKVTRL